MPPVVRRRRPAAVTTIAKIIETKEVLIRSLKPYYKNPRIGDVGAIAESLEANGQFKPIVVNVGTQTGRKNEVLAGNHTYLAARHLGWTKIIASFVDVDEDRAKRIVLADNASSDKGQYDTGALAALIGELPDVAGTGYSQSEVQAILDSVPKVGDMVIDDAPPRDIRDILNNIPSVGPDKSSRAKRKETMTDEQKEAARNRGVAIEDEDTSEDELEAEEEAGSPEQRQLIEYQAVLETRLNEDWFGGNFWQVPDLRADMLCDGVPDNIRCWAGNEVSGEFLENDPEQWFMYNVSTGGIKGLPWNQTVLAFNTYDDKFLNWWEQPAWYVAKMLQRGLTVACCPDNSFYSNMPRSVHLRGVYQSQWMGRFFQEAGIKVIPRIQFDDEKSLDFNLLGIPAKPPVVSCSLQNFTGNRDTGSKTPQERERHFKGQLRILQKCVDKLAVQHQVIVYGEAVLKYLDMLKPKTGAEVIGVSNYISERRELVFGKKDGMQSLNAKQIRKIRERAIGRMKARDPELDVAYEEEALAVDGAS